jgi:putative transposase
MIKPPAISTVRAVLDRNGLVKRRKRRRYKAQGTALADAHDPNGLWCADYKGECMLGNKQYCYPLTITDYRSRYLIACEGLPSTRSDLAFTVFEQAFKDFGLPRAIRTGNALCGLSKLAVWWLRLRIHIQRINPATRNKEENALTRLPGFTITNVHTRPCAARIPAISIHPQPGSTNRRLTPTTPFTIAPSASPAAAGSASVGAKST